MKLSRNHFRAFVMLRTVLLIIHTEIHFAIGIFEASNTFPLAHLVVGVDIIPETIHHSKPFSLTKWLFPFTSRSYGALIVNLRG